MKGKDSQMGIHSDGVRGGIEGDEAEGGKGDRKNR